MAMTTHVPPTTWTAAHRAGEDSREHRNTPPGARWGGRLPDRVHLRRGMRLRGRIRMPRVFRHQRRGG
jgi:hypothetical protein